MANRRNSPGKTRLEKLFITLHKFRAPPAMIRALTGYSDSYIRQLLDESGHRERWSDVADFSASLPPDVVEECAQVRNNV